MKHPLCAALGALLTLASPLAAQDAIWMPYEAFEMAVPHIDLDTCPPGVTDLPAFCRATLANDELHVFAFSENGENLLVAMKSFPASGLENALTE